MIEFYKEDPIVLFLLRSGYVTEAQLDTILLARTKGKLAEKTQMRSKVVSKGAFVRTMRQGQSNIESAVYTLLLLGYLGLVSFSKFEQLLRTEKLISLAKEAGLGKEDSVRIVNGMKEFAEQFSGRAKAYTVM